jgi:sRNA-binding carbon storage regulator CsrA
VTVLSVDGDKVKLGIAAPKEIPILRQELHQALIDQKLIETRLSSGPEPESLRSLRELLSAEFSDEAGGKKESSAADSSSEEASKKSGENA